MHTTSDCWLCVNVCVSLYFPTKKKKRNAMLNGLDLLDAIQAEKRTKTTVQRNHDLLMFVLSGVYLCIVCLPATVTWMRLCLRKYCGLLSMCCTCIRAWINNFQAIRLNIVCVLNRRNPWQIVFGLANALCLFSYTACVTFSMYCKRSVDRHSETVNRMIRIVPLPYTTQSSQNWNVILLHTDTIHILYRFDGIRLTVNDRWNILSMCFS